MFFILLKVSLFMELKSLDSSLNAMMNSIFENNIEKIQQNLIGSENQNKEAQLLLSQIESIIKAMGETWKEEHDVQGKLITEQETVTFSDFETFYAHVLPLFELIRARLYIKGSHQKIGVGTLVNVHNISELVELKLRSQGFLTYYFGHSLTTKAIKKQVNHTPVNILVLSIMGVNDQLPGFEELKLIRQEYPELRIIVGGPAFPLFTLLKEGKDLEKLTNPYKTTEYTEAIKKSSTIEEFVKNVFDVEYIENLDQLVTIL